MFETLLYFNEQFFDLGAGAVRPSVESTNSNTFTPKDTWLLL